MMIGDNQALDAEPPIASFLRSMLVGGGPVNAIVRCNRDASDVGASFRNRTCYI
jgi:hypothetical protein